MVVMSAIEAVMASMMVIVSATTHVTMMVMVMVMELRLMETVTVTVL